MLSSAVLHEFLMIFLKFLTVSNGQETIGDPHVCWLGIVYPGICHHYNQPLGANVRHKNI